MLYCAQAFLKKYPKPDKNAPDVAIGHVGQASYTNGFQHYRKLWFMDVGGARGDSPFNVFHIGVLDGDHHCHGTDTWLIDAESSHAYKPILAAAKARNPILDAPGARCCKDDHTGAQAAFVDVMKAAVPLSCQMHFRRHVLVDAAWGVVDVRRDVADRCMAMAKEPDSNENLLKLEELKRVQPAAYQKLTKTHAVEELFPSMAAHPTGLRNKDLLIGPTHSIIASNEAEVTMHMYLRVRRIANIGEQQIAAWELRQRRQRELTAKLRQAQANDRKLLPFMRGLTPYVRKRMEPTIELANKVQVKWKTPTTCEASSLTKTARWYTVDISEPQNPARLCSKGCCLARDGVCHHVMAVLKEVFAGKTSCALTRIADFVPADQTLRGWAKQLGVSEELVDSAVDDAAFPLPSMDRVFQIMENDPRVRMDVAPPDVSCKRQKGRIKGSWEDKGTQKKRLQKELAQGKNTGCDATLVSHPFPCDALTERTPTGIDTTPLSEATETARQAQGRSVKAAKTAAAETAAAAAIHGDLKALSKPKLSELVRKLPRNPSWGQVAVGNNRGGGGGEQLCNECSIKAGFQVRISGAGGCGGRYVTPPHSGWVDKVAAREAAKLEKMSKSARPYKTKEAVSESVVSCMSTLGAAIGTLSDEQIDAALRNHFNVAARLAVTRQELITSHIEQQVTRQAKALVAALTPAPTPAPAPEAEESADPSTRSPFMVHDPRSMNSARSPFVSLVESGPEKFDKIDLESAKEGDAFAVEDCDNVARGDWRCSILERGPSQVCSYVCSLTCTAQHHFFTLRNYSTNLLLIPRSLTSFLGSGCSGTPAQGSGTRRPRTTPSLRNGACTIASPR